MLFANLVKQRLEIPDHPGQWVEIRKLGWRKLREAADVLQRAAYEHVRVLGKDGLEAVRNVTAEQIASFKRNTAAQFDTGTLLRAAVVTWSLSDRPTPEELDELPEPVVLWLVDEILALSRPPHDEAAVKNA